MKKTAVVSECGTYRYRLGRRWDDGPAMLFVMLNPSTADAEQDDPTIRKCIGFATRKGFGAVEVVNLFGYRATNPADLKAAGYDSGPENQRAITDAVRESIDEGGAIVLAWGANARGLAAPVVVQGIVRGMGAKAHALRLLDDGTPAHPLMLPYSCELVEVAGAGAMVE
ncbi:DUF1643 domain-containing protein [Cupriavidus basilensis]|uniref:DUF1643 domain-containing protein n=1 Tax=Cupriavidus basilensis TaxID=68895 RepID=A0A0C4Y199_9BURK|nr:DUF1643 domain-containing protein [Cupriavidus basilensis]AJG18802.1 hypothetical protein RR42_m1400 [Cupriavidus basilensis]